MPTGERVAGAKAVFSLLNYSDRTTWALRCYNHLPGFAPLSEFAYRFIAGHRGFFYRVTVLLFGRRIQPASHHGIEWLFLRLLAVVYFAAFVSFGVQVRGLIGSHGILPAAGSLEGASQYLGAVKAWPALPGLFSLNTTPPALTLPSLPLPPIPLISPP